MKGKGGVEGGFPNALWFATNQKHHLARNLCDV